MRDKIETYITVKYEPDAETQSQLSKVVVLRLSIFQGTKFADEVQMKNGGFGYGG